MLSFSHSILCLSGALQDTGGVGALLAVIRDGEAYAPTYDVNGNVSEYIQLSTVQTDNYPSLPIAGGIAAHYEYDTFGGITAQSGGMADGFMFRFSTKYYETETAILHYEKRPYYPSTGCWLNKDSIGEQGGLNLYGFCGGVPVNNWDYLGLDVRGWSFAGDPEDPDYRRGNKVYLPVYGSTQGQMSVKWDINVTDCTDRSQRSETFGPRIYSLRSSDGGGYYPLISTHRRLNTEERLQIPVRDNGFGMDVLTGRRCYEGTITITIKDSGERIKPEKPYEWDHPGMTTNLGQHAFFLGDGDLSGDALVITVAFDCEGGYKVTSDPKIRVSEKRPGGEIKDLEFE